MLTLLINKVMHIHFPILCRVLPFAIYIVFLAFDSFFILALDTLSITAEWLYAWKAFSVAAVLVYFRSNYRELSNKPSLLNLIYAVFTGILVFILWIIPYPVWMTFENSTEDFNPLINQITLASIVWISIRMIGATLIVPLMEELFWRSFLMRWLDHQNFMTLSPAKISMYALFISSALFAIEHQLWLAGLFAGLTYGQLYRSTQNIWIPITAHAVTNGLLGLWVISTQEWYYW